MACVWSNTSTLSLEKGDVNASITPEPLFSQLPTSVGALHILAIYHFVGEQSQYIHKHHSY